MIFPKTKAPLWGALITRRKRREFDGFLEFFAGSENPCVRGALCTFEITLSQAITLTLLLVCAFSPRVLSIPRGPLSMKLQENKKRQGYPAVFSLVVKGENLMDFWGSLRVQKILVYVAHSALLKSRYRKR